MLTVLTFNRGFVDVRIPLWHLRAHYLHMEGGGRSMPFITYQKQGLSKVMVHFTAKSIDSTVLGLSC